MSGFISWKGDVSPMKALQNENDTLQARIAELEKLHSEHLDEMRLHYEDVHAEEVNELNSRIAELEKKINAMSPLW